MQLSHSKNYIFLADTQPIFTDILESDTYECISDESITIKEFTYSAISSKKLDFTPAIFRHIKHVFVNPRINGGHMVLGCLS